MRRFYSSSADADPEDLNVAQQVVRRIDEMIGTGELSPGERLVEAKLAADLGVSRIPVREALRILAGDGVVVLVRNSGARVAQMSPLHMRNMLRVLVGLLIVGLDHLSELEDIVEIVVKLREQVEKIEAARKSRDGLHILNETSIYQNLICSYAGNEYLSSLVGSTRFGNFTAQLFPIVPMSVILSISQCYKKMTEFVEIREFKKAGNVLKRYAKELDDALTNANLSWMKMNSMSQLSL